MSTITFVPAIGQYADAVRAALTGLDYRQVQDLTDGLEMDLTDALADDPAAPGADGASSEGADEDRPDGARLTFDRLVERFGDPGVYADELRVSAGLPGRAGQAASGSETVELEVQTAAQPEAPARRSLAEIWAVVGDKWGDKRWWRLGAWLVPVLRPVWWVARGAALGVFVSWRAGYYQVAALVATGLAGVAASLALAKVDWSAKSRALRVLMAVTNTVLAFLLVVTVLTVGAATEAGMVAEEPYVYEQGGSDPACGWEG
ncbi:MAG: hypothetical protein LBG11_11660, partial [Bifidobacteriaceae bacterium]|nr:hypothetical protein [Bifidobacteriaceae bacterium]